VLTSGGPFSPAKGPGNFLDSVDNVDCLWRESATHSDVGKPFGDGHVAGSFMPTIKAKQRWENEQVAFW
jgi:hypothetical protein